MTLIRADSVTYGGTWTPPMLQSFTWAKDGRSLAWARRLRDFNGLSCERRQSQVLVFHIATRMTTIGVVTDRDIGNLAFSPDAHRIAYVVHRDGASAQLHVASLP